MQDRQRKRRRLARARLRTPKHVLARKRVRDRLRLDRRRVGVALAGHGLQNLCRQAEIGERRARLGRGRLNNRRRWCVDRRGVMG